MKKSSFIEVVKVIDGAFVDVQPHINRIIRTTTHFFSEPLIVDLTNNMIPVALSKGTVKCRIVYNSEVVSIDYASYEMRDIRSLAIIESSEINYSYKYLNRDSINNLYARRKKCDDILILKNSLVTDTSFSNVVFKDSEGKLYTPTTPLLAGTKRERLLATGVIQEKEIHLNDIHSYVGVYLINAMIDIEDNLFVGIDAIL